MPFPKLLPSLILLLGLLVIGCKSKTSPIPKADEKVFQQYWFQGKAEISSYKLTQARYGASHEGHAVLVFVKEDFSKLKHVKLDDPQKHKSDALPVMKMNMNKEFVTGIYQYNMMNSVFTPLDVEHYPHSLKLTSGSQDWCGQSFMQYNWKGNRYEVQQMSYFEKEGDTRFTLANGWLEDELWTRIRIAPESLPLGKVKMMASAFYIRLSHAENKIYEAEATLHRSDGTYRYGITYPELGRALTIQFESSFPHRILSWTEHFGENEVTSGTLLQSIMSDYWTHNQPQDTLLHHQLELPH